jgi:hypothetical protein
MTGNSSTELKLEIGHGLFIDPRFEALAENIVLVREFRASSK